MILKMNSNAKCRVALGVCAVFAACALKADDPTPSPLQSQVQTHLRLEIKDDVKEVHFINTNNDPYVYTKVYSLKYADPYEIQPYLQNSIGGYCNAADNTVNNDYGRRVNTSATKVECIKYMDGLGMLVVSAEDYRFTDSGKENAMSIDEIVAILDQPDISYNDSLGNMLYFPKYRAADKLVDAIRRSGMNGADESKWELEGGADSVRVDSGLNGLLFTYSTYSKKNIETMLALYDRPNPELAVTFTVYEVAKENDSQIGDDFQSWLNGPGSDLFSVGATSARNWDASNMIPSKTGSSNTKFVNFSPKWSTKYLDFLSSKGSAQVVTSGTLSLMTGTTGYAGSTCRLPTITTGAARGNGGITAVRYYKYSGALANVTFGAVTGYDSSNQPIVVDVIPTTAKGVSMTDYLFPAGGNGNFTIVEAQTNKTNTNGDNVVGYYYSIEASSGANMQDANGKNLGNKAKAYSSSQISLAVTAPTGTDPYGAAVTWTTGNATDNQYASLAMQKAPKRNTTIQTVASAGDNYGFEMTLIPTVNEESSTLSVEMINTNLVGFNSDGSIRTNRSHVKTQVSVANNGQKFVVGGLDKEQVVRSETGLPWLNNIPVLGWAFANEKESHKNSQLVLVMECAPVMPYVALPAEVMSKISETKNKIDNYGVKAGPIDENDFGFEQFILDGEKKSLDPLP